MPSSPSEPQPASLWLRLLGTVWALLALAVMVTFWQSPYLFTLASAFRFHWLLGLLLVGLLLAFFHRDSKRWIFLALPLAVGVTFLSYFTPAGARLPAQSSNSLRVAVSNLLTSNHDLTRFRDWITKEQPDLVALVEVSEAHRAQLEELPYDFKFLHPRQPDNFGLGLLCRRPPLEAVVLDESTPFPSLLATWPEYRLLITHPMPPISAGARFAGDEQMKRLVEGLVDAGPPLLVVGDLNATGWDRRLRPLQDAGMLEARSGHGLLPTWPTGLPIFGIPIDHIYLPAGWESHGCRRGPNIGSDHYPLVCDAVMPFTAAKAP